MITDQNIDITHQNIDITQACQGYLYTSRNQSAGYAEPLLNHNQFYAHNTQMFRAHLKRRIQAFSLTGETPTHEPDCRPKHLYAFY